MRSFEIPLSLNPALTKSASEMIVGGIASGFFRDLDGEAITPGAIAQAIPAFMAPRGADGIKGGELRLHHDFWQRFLKQAIATLNLPAEKQMELVAAIALPLGRVTEMTVDETGTTHWKGVLSKANPIASIIWRMLKEKLISLGVSLGGKIFNTEMGRDSAGKPCRLITDIRLDEISITSNPAYRLTEGEGTGAYISALAKSVRSAIGDNMTTLLKAPTPVEHATGQAPETHHAFYAKNSVHVSARSPEHAQEKIKSFYGSSPDVAFHKIHSIKETTAPSDDNVDNEGHHLGIYQASVGVRHHVSAASPKKAQQQIQNYYNKYPGQRSHGLSIAATDLRHMPTSDNQNHEFEKLSNPAYGHGGAPHKFSRFLKAADKAKVELFLKKAIGGSPKAEENSGSWGETKTGMGKDNIANTSARSQPKGKIQTLADSTVTGMGGKSAAPARPSATATIPLSDSEVTIAALVQDLSKCAGYDRKQMGKDETLKKFGDTCNALAASTNSPPPAMINLIRLLGMFSRFAAELPSMSDFQADGTVAAMSGDLKKAIEDFQEHVPSELQGKRITSPGFPGIQKLDIAFPQQYVSLI
jgi:Caudovirus prohead serine protease